MSVRGKLFLLWCLIGCPLLAYAGASEVVAGAAYSAALSSNGSVFAWGDFSGITTGFRQNPALTKPAPVLASAVTLGAGYYHTLALKDDRSVWAWGSNSNGQLAAGSFTISSATPIPVSGLTSVRALAAGGFHSLALMTDGTAKAWGQNTYGQLGIGGSGVDRVAAPTTIRNLTQVDAVAGGFAHTLALDALGRVWSWGLNTYNQLGYTTFGPAFAPAQVPGLPKIVAIAAGGYHSMALSEDGSVWTWGQNDYGQIGVPGPSAVKQPVQVAGLASIRSIKAGHHHSLALGSDGTVWAWGEKQGNGRAEDSAAATRVSIPKTIQAIAAGMSHSAAMDTEGLVWSWGINHDGQLGDGTYARQLPPVLVVNENTNGFLDLIPGDPNTIPPDKIPPFLLATYATGSLKSTTLYADLRGIIPTGSFASASDYGKFAADYNVYVAANVPTSPASPYFQLNANNSWSVLTWPMAEFLRGVALDSQNNVVTAQILQNADLSSPELVGASILVGYGTDPDEMLRTARYRTIFTLPTQ